MVAAAGVCAGALLVDHSRTLEHASQQRAAVQSSLSSMRARLETELNGRIHLARGLEALAVARPDLGEAEFRAFARVMQGQQSGLRSLQLARDAIVTHIYPESGNEAARGHSLLSDALTAEAAREAVLTRRFHLAGPYTLRQGGEGLVARQPVFVADGSGGERFWGFATVLLDFQSVMRVSGIPERTDLRFAIRGRDGRGAAGDVFYGEPRLFTRDALTTEVRFPGGYWIVAAEPVGGWDASWPGRPALYAATALLLLAIPLAMGAFARVQRVREEARRLGLRERLLNSLGEGVYGVDRMGCCTFINPAALRLLGYERDEVLGQDTRVLFHGPGLGSQEAMRQPRSRGIWFLRKDGTRFPVEVTTAPIEGDGGCVVAFNDMTEQRQSEERLRLAASVFAHTQQGIMITDAGGELLDVNPAFTEITGYAREEVLGRSPKILSSGRQTPEFYASMKQSLAATGFWRGEIWNRHKSGKAYPELLSIAAVEDGHGGVSHYIGVFSDISRQKQHESELARIAHYDALTSLPNRALLTERLTQGLEQAWRGKSRMAVCMLDLDRFKQVNDDHGHDAGDAVLVEMAMRLKATVRAGDTVARLGGDEFVLLLMNVDGLAACESHAHRVLKAINVPIALAQGEVTLSASLGMTIFPDDAADAETLMRHADQAMYAAKQEGRARYRLFDPEQDRQARTHRETLERIALGIANDEFRLHFQPKVDVRAGRVESFEALARWQHPSQGLLGPGQFLPVIADTELDVELGRWVLHEALRQLAEWRAMGFSFGVSVNVSGRHLLTPGFSEELAALLAKHPTVERNALEIEILETAALADLDAASEVLRECLYLGVSTALDDFGTGYSSLAYFRRLPVKTLKIDQVFIRGMLEDPDDMAIVEGIIRFARAFDRNLVAEGAELPELCTLLAAMGCEKVQGHGVAPPMPPERVPEWVARFRPDPAWEHASVWHPQELPLLAAELLHRRWVAEVQSWVQGRHEQQPPPDADACGFGRWYESGGRQRYGRVASWEKLGEMHEAVHALAEALIHACLEGRHAEARARLPELSKLRDRLLGQLRQLRVPVPDGVRLSV